MFKVPESVWCVPYDQLVDDFQASRPLPLPCMAISPFASLPTKENADDFGWDIYPCKSVDVGVDTVAVDTGLAVAIPPGYGAFLKERSGLARKYGVKLMGVRLVYPDGTHEDISGGVIDAGYRGPLIALLAVRSGHPPRTFTPEDKVSQLVILPAPKFYPFWVGELPPSDRGENGFGNSGGVGSPIKPEPSLGPLEASVKRPEPEACPYEANAWKSLLEAPSVIEDYDSYWRNRSRCIPEPTDLDHVRVRGINGRPPQVSAESPYYRGDFSLRDLGESPLRRAYRVWMGNGGPAAHSQVITDEMKERIKAAMLSPVEPAINIEPLVTRYQEQLYAEALANVGRVVQGSVTINGIKLPISSAVLYESGHYKTIIEGGENGPLTELGEKLLEDTDEIPTVHRCEMRITEVHPEPSSEEWLDYRGVNEDVSPDTIGAATEATHQRERKEAMDRFEEWVKNGQDRPNPEGSFTF